MKAFIEQNQEQLLATLKELCAIPAPSHKEQQRARYCRDWLERAGAEGVYIDDALNVIYPHCCGDSRNITVFAAHTDTVFPDLEPMPYLDDGERIHCPGVGDDTASLAILLTLVKYFLEKGIQPKNGVLFVCNSCEEGLGNLKGVRQLFHDYEGRIGKFISFDSRLGSIIDNCVGSHRYEVEVKTEGGHSFINFGNDNAIQKLSEIVSEIYRLQVPEKAGTHTTYNVGVLSGGTSVNTIAQSASMLCEYRSDDAECLEKMRICFEDLFARARSEKVQVLVRKVGDRPCSRTDSRDIEPLRRALKPLIEEITGRPARFGCGSTDSNIPLSLGIPAITMGVYEGAGCHTREEWILKSSLPVGLETAIRAALKLTGDEES